jgi:mobilome CxxCx(11)CxxC protein
MNNPHAADTIRQSKLNSLAAKHLHVKRQATLNRWNQLIDFLALGVPVMYFAIRYVAKGTGYEQRAEVSWELLAGALLVLTILKLVCRWQEKAQEHSKLLGENISIVGLADNLLANPAGVSQENLQFFSLLVQKSEREDRNALGQPSEKDKQFAYREALKEADPGNVHVKCPSCKSSPWNFTPGSCQLCGNTPAPK